MTDIEQKRANFRTWWVAYQLTGFIQQCFFSAWIVVVLYAISAPFWVWVVGLMYSLGHWVHYLCHLAANFAQNELRKTEEKSDAAI